MAFAQVALLDGQLWEFELHADQNVISTGLLQEWLSGVQPVGFVEEIHVVKVVVNPNSQEFSVTSDSSQDKSKWYVVKLSGNHKDETVDQIFSKCLSHSKNIGNILKICRLARNYGLWIFKGGDHQLLYLDYLVNRKLWNERRVKVVDRFREMIEKNCEMKFERMKQLAEDYQLMSGHWSLCLDYSQSSLVHKVNSTWRQLSDAFFAGPLHSRATGLSLKVTYDGYAFGVKTADFSHQSRVFAIEQLIRQAGVDGTLKYKPDVYSLCDIYHGNQLTIRPTIYQSTADMRERISTITTDYTPGYSPEILMDEPFQNAW